MKINERLGEVVCICERSGNISVYDLNAWRRAQAIRKEKTERSKSGDVD